MANSYSEEDKTWEGADCEFDGDMARMIKDYADKVAYKKRKSGATEKEIPKKKGGKKKAVRTLAVGASAELADEIDDAEEEGEAEEPTRVGSEEIKALTMMANALVQSQEISGARLHTMEDLQAKVVDLLGDQQKGSSTSTRQKVLLKGGERAGVMGMAKRWEDEGTLRFERWVTR